MKYRQTLKFPYEHRYSTETHIRYLAQTIVSGMSMEDLEKLFDTTVFDYREVDPEDFKGLTPALQEHLRELHEKQETEIQVELSV